MAQAQAGGAPAMPSPKGRMSSAVSIMAVAIAAAALVTALAIPGPAGPTGPTGATGATGATGPTGPAGPGTLMNSATSTLAVTIGTACTHYTDAAVSLTVPGPGTVVVQAAFDVVFDHTSGTRDAGRFVLSDAPDTCDIDSFYTLTEVRYALPTEAYPLDLFLLEPFPVTAAGSYTFNLNGFMYDGATPGDQFFQASLVAVFYPG